MTESNSYSNKRTQTKRLSNLERRLTDTEHSIKHIFQTIIQLQERLNNFDDFLHENIEAIKCIKADKEDVIEELEKKANQIDVEKKVEYHTFEHIRKDISAGLIIAMEKVENMFRQLIDVKSKIEEFELYRVGCEENATNAKSKLLAEFKATKKMKTNNFDEENEEKLKSTMRRYCGGLHTKSNAMERIFKKYNFFDAHPEVEPCASCLDEHTFKAGTDGILYRVQKIKCDCNGPEFGSSNLKNK